MWQPTPILRQSRAFAPQVAVSAEDNPPFRNQGRNSLSGILAQWQPTPAASWPERWATRHVPVAISAIPENDPPFGIPHPVIWTILRAWQPGPPRSPVGPLHPLAFAGTLPNSIIFSEESFVGGSFTNESFVAGMFDNETF